ncbi:hypothetical protein GVAV_000417 [Gurleya vavrai]
MDHNDGYLVTLSNGSKKYTIADLEKENEGTDVIVWLHENIELNNSDVQKWVNENLIRSDAAQHYNIRVRKTDEEKVNERNEEIKRRKDEIQKKKDEKKKRQDDRKKKIEEKKKEIEEKKIKKESIDNKDVEKDTEKDIESEKLDKENTENEKGEEEKIEEEKIEEETVEDFDSSHEEIDENLYEENIEISDYRILQLAPWAETDSEEELKKIYKERYNKNDLQFSQKVQFNVKQKNDKGKEWNTRFEALIYIPEAEDQMSMRQEKKEGKIETFVSGSKINDPYLENVGEFLKSFNIIIKSNEALLASTREEFYDSKNTVKNICNALIRKISDIFIGKGDDVIHKYSKIIKTGFIESKRNGNESILDRLAGIITFESNEGVFSLNKFVNMIEENNKIDEVKEDEEKKDEVKENENKEDEKEIENKEDDEEKKDDEKEIEKKDEKEQADKKKKEKKYATIDNIYFTNTNMSLVKNVLNPLFDGVNVPFTFLSDIHDEEIINVLKNYRGYRFVNISTKKFENRVIEKEDDEKFKNVKESIKKILSPFVSDVVLSKRLVKLPFSIIVPENSMSSAYRSVIGENGLENNPFRMMFDPKPTLEINIDSAEIKRIKDLVDIGSNDVLKNAILSMYLGTCIACRVDPYSKVDAYQDLMNVSRNLLSVDEVKKQVKADNDFSNMFGAGGMPFGGMGGDGFDPASMTEGLEDAEDDDDVKEELSEEEEIMPEEENVKEEIESEAEKETIMDEEIQVKDDL